MPKKLHWLIIYDIRQAKRLQKVAKLMAGVATRVQKSVFELNAPQTVVNELRLKTLTLIDPQKDFIVYFNICEKDWQKRQKYGPQEFAEEEEKPFYIFD